MNNKFKTEIEVSFLVRPRTPKQNGDHSCQDELMSLTFKADQHAK